MRLSFLLLFFVTTAFAYLHAFPTKPAITTNLKPVITTNLKPAESKQIAHINNNAKQEGQKKFSSKYSAGGYNVKKGEDKKHYHENKKHGVSDKEEQKKTSSEKGGLQKKHHDVGTQKSQYKKGKKNRKSAKFGEKKGHKKGHKTKGYHNKFYKDEYYKEHRFYDDAHHSGFYEKEGQGNSYYQKHLENLQKLARRNRRQITTY